LASDSNIEWNTKSKGGLWGYRFFIFILKKFGIPFTYFFVRIIAFFYFLFLPKTFKITYFYFHSILHYNSIKSVYKIFINYVLLGEVIVDKIASLLGYNNLYTFHFEGEEEMKSIIEGKKGGIFIGAHIGNWEIASHQLNRFNGKINILMLDAELKKIQKLLPGIRSHYPENVNIIIIRNDSSHIYYICKALQNKEVVFIHGDRIVNDNSLVIKQWMGKNTRFSTGPFALAGKFKVPVCYFYGMKEPKRHYHLYAFTSAVDTSSASKSIPLELLDEFVNNLEFMLKKYPDQWFNYYDFWKEK